ncbi:MAG TPA: flavin reductase family protein [Gemmataceae bacterium]|nr:flavin reductase family protein [Gemmataceae bacterium]
MSDFASALGRIPSGLFIVTLRHDDAEPAMLASWVQQCSFDPPLLSVAVKKGRDIAASLTEGTRFAVNILAEGQSSIVSHFAQGKKLTDPPFDQAGVQRVDGQPPLLTEALAVLQCEVITTYITGDHQLFIARIQEGTLRGGGRPWVHIRKNGLNY